MMQPNIGKLKFILALDGNIASGKSSALEDLEEKYKEFNGIKLIYVKEPSKIWTTKQMIPDEYLPHLEKAEEAGRAHPEAKEAAEGVMYLPLFYGDKKKHSFVFQVFAYNTRTSAIYAKIREQLEKDEDYGLVIERGVHTDKEVFVKTLIEDGDFSPASIPAYDGFFREFAEPLIEHLTAILYLDVAPEVCVRRIVRRDRISEDSISMDYLVKLQAAHERMLDKYKEKKIYTIDWNQDKFASEKTKLNMEKLLEDTFVDILSSLCNKEHTTDLSSRGAASLSHSGKALSTSQTESSVSIASPQYEVVIA